MPRAAFTDALDKDAGYVDIDCDGDTTILLSSGSLGGQHQSRPEHPGSTAGNGGRKRPKRLIYFANMTEGFSHY